VVWGKYELYRCLVVLRLDEEQLNVAVESLQYFASNAGDATEVAAELDLIVLDLYYPFDDGQWQLHPDSSD
jgi:hypothetical protein